MHEKYLPNLPEALTLVADALVDYLTCAPFAEAKQCPWCGSHLFFSYPKEKRCNCKSCKRAFTPLTNSPFANCRHQEKWAVYARYRLAGHPVYHAGLLSGLAQGTAKYREEMIVQMIGERWPTLLSWWSGRRQLNANGKPAPLRSRPFTNLEEARAHHAHEYIQCLECGKMYSQLSGHLISIHEMTALEYREKWQIMKQVPLAGLGCRKKHSNSIKEKIASGDVDPQQLVALMHEANKRRLRKKPFKTHYELESSRLSMLERQPWHISPAIKIVDEDTKRRAVERVNNRAEGETIKSVAKELGVWPGTLWTWRKQFASNDSAVSLDENRSQNQHVKKPLKNKT